MIIIISGSVMIDIMTLNYMINYLKMLQHDNKTMIYSY